MPNSYLTLVPATFSIIEGREWSANECESLRQLFQKLNRTTSVKWGAETESAEIEYIKNQIIFDTSELPGVFGELDELFSSQEAFTCHALKVLQHEDWAFMLSALKEGRETFLMQLIDVEEEVVYEKLEKQVNGSPFPPVVCQLGNADLGASLKAILTALNSHMADKLIEEKNSKPSTVSFAGKVTPYYKVAKKHTKSAGVRAVKPAGWSARKFFPEKTDDSRKPLEQVGVNCKC